MRRVKTVEEIDLLRNLGRNVRGLRTLRGWRQADLAEYAHTSQNIISDIEAGRTCSIHLLRVVAGALDLTPDVLLWPTKLLYEHIRSLNRILSPASPLYESKGRRDVDLEDSSE